MKGLSVLVTLAHIRGSKHGNLIAEQLVDVTMRVKDVRKFPVQNMVLLLLDPKVMVGQGLNTVSEVLCAACWITGEYAAFLEGIHDDETRRLVGKPFDEGHGSVRTRLAREQLVGGPRLQRR